MKTILLNCLMLFALVEISANVPSPDEYVKTKDDVLYYSKLTFGSNKARLILDNGQKITLMNNEVIAYKKNEKIFEKMPLYNNNKKTNKEVFMEVLKYTNGMKLYRYTTYGQEVNFPYHVSSTKKVEKYYVFRNGNYHLQIDEANYKTVFAFFGIKARLE